jgi:hypothetical protein
MIGRQLGPCHIIAKLGEGGWATSTAPMIQDLDAMSL